MDTLADGRALNMRGFALLTMLLVVALVSILLGGLIYQQGREVARTSVLLNQAQAMAVAGGLEAWVRKGLALDAEHSKIDTLQEQWAQPLPPVLFAGGTVSGRLEDGQSKINLNNIGLAAGAQQKYWREVIGRIFQAHDVPENLLDPLQDWVDQDEPPLPQGAESDDYLLHQPAYRSGNQPLLVLQALRWVKGFTSQHIVALQPVAATLPTLTPVNINTASEAVLQGLAPWLDQALASQWVRAREAAPAKRIEDFWRFMAQATGKPLDEVKNALPTWALSVNSRYFILHGRLEYGASQVAIGGLFYREQKQSRLLMRWLEPVWE